MHPDDLFTAPQLASLCGVELKTIHNWIAKGMIRHFRSPGRHIRIRRVDLLEFMEKFGYPIPEDLKAKANRPVVAVVDDDPETIHSIKKALNRKFDIRGYANPYTALIAFGAEPPAAVVLNMNLEGFDDVKVIENIKRTPQLGKIPIITFGSNSFSRENVIKAGAVDYLPREELKRVKGILEETLQA